MDHLLLTTLPRAAREELESLPELLDQVMPVKGRHRKDLPKSVADLSERLTARRGDLRGDYLQSPADQSAYLRYFLPWNLYRLCRLLPDLDLRLDRRAKDEADTPAMVLDLGSGPLTLPIALWLCRPDLREKELSFVCVDRSRKIMAQGRDLFRLLANKHKDGPGWRISLLHEPVHKALSLLRGRPSLVAAVNVLNEMGQSRNKTPLEMQLEDLALRLSRNLEKPGRLLFMEPGTRFGGKLVSMARKGALEAGLYPLSPCPHAAACPALAPEAPAWCHFTFAALDSPSWLQELSKRAGMGKSRLSLSFALMGDKPASVPPHTARVVSDAFSLPGYEHPARYSCTDRGWVLAQGPECQELVSGALVCCQWPAQEQRDAKSGAPIVHSCTPCRP